jgi:YVTN family beta-propeller protein
MKKPANMYMLAILLALSFLACSEEDSGLPEYRNGKLLLNTGNFSEGNGSLDFIPAEGESIRSIFHQVNQQAPGGILEDLQFTEGKPAALISNVPDQLMLLDANTLELQARISDENALHTPRYSSWAGNELFVSTWGPFTLPDYNLESSSLSVIDPQTQSVNANIPVPAGPEGILTVNEQLWVACSFTDTLAIVDPASRSIAKKIRTPFGPSHLLADEQNRVWLSCSSGFLLAFAADTQKELFRIDLQGASPSGKMQRQDNYLYFLARSYDASYNSFGSIYRIDLRAATPQPEELVSNAANLSCFLADTDGKLWLGYAAGAEPGTLILQNAEGEQLQSWPAGIFPHQLHKR